MARNPSASAGTEAWSKGVQAGGDKLKAGVERVQESPTHAAARQLTAMRQNFLTAMDSGFTQQQLMNSTLQDWKGPMLGKGLANYRNAGTTGKQAYQTYAARAYPVLAQASAAAEQVDKTSMAGKLERVRIAVEASQSLKGTR